MRSGTGIVIALLVVLANFVGWSAINRPVEPAPWWHAINGVSFSPYRADQDPRSGRHPTPAEIDRDLELVASQVRQVRTYSATDGLDVVAPLAERHGLLVTAGAWIDGRTERNEREVANVVRMARFNRNVTRVLVGNETILRADVSVEDLIRYIRRVRTQVKVPVSTAEPWHVWLAHPELAREVDFIAIHILPYWEGLPVDKAIEYVLLRYQQVKDAFPTKPVVITEVGWPSDGRTRRAAEPTTTAQADFLRTFLNEANKRGFDYYIMEAFDQPWKRSIEGSVGAYWGIYDADRNQKFSMVGPVASQPNWMMLAAVASLLALLPMMWFLRRWPQMQAAGRVFYAGLIQGTASVLVFVIDTGLGQYMTVGTFLMWAMLLPLLVALLVMVLTEALEFAEVAWMRPHKRRFLPFVTDVVREWPKVSIHLPIHNEPPELVQRTLDALARLDYPDFEVVIVDNNTRDEAVWRPVEAYCQQLGPRFKFFHVSPLKGFKAGALNFALRNTAPDVSVVGVIDSDYLVEPNWLKSVIPYFDRPEVGFVQAPQDHHDWKGDAFKEMMNWEYAGFFQIGMVQRNENDAIIQHGTMTLIRRAAIEQVGDWAEWCITEDAEMGLRLLAGGWQSVYLNQRFGYGVTPDSFSGYKSQRFRWAYGAVQILKRHWREVLPGAKGKLDAMQRYHFVAGWLPWFADAIGLVFAVAGLVWTVGVLTLPRYFEFPLTLFLLPALAVFGAKVVQFVVIYRLRVDCTWRQRLGAGIAGLALTYTIAKATLYGIFTEKLPFIRTPKCEDQPAFVQALAMAREESILFVLLWLAGTAIWSVYGGDDPEARIWALMMFVQSLPFGASLLTSAVNTLPQLRRRAPAPVAQPAPTVAVPATGN